MTEDVLLDEIKRLTIELIDTRRMFAAAVYTQRDSTLRIPNSAIVRNFELEREDEQDYITYRARIVG